ncbi:MAG: DUF364 domain-containing protein [Bacillota bacterium]|nr:DUF364 domain-containing protein [Bacillota bacterium]
MQLLEKVYALAEPYLAGRRVVDGVLGLNFVGAQLDNGSCHFITLMREALPPGESCGHPGLDMLEQPAAKIARWALEGKDDLQRSLGMAVLNAVSPFYPRDTAPEQEEKDDGLPLLQPGDTLGMIGFMRPSIRRLLPHCKRIIIFDRAQDPVEKQAREQELLGEKAAIYPMELQPELLPLCDVVIITGTSMVNHSTEYILSHCGKAREVLLKGFSFPYYPEAYADTPISSLGSVYFNADAAALFRPLSLGGGKEQVMAYAHHCQTRIKA